MSNNNSSSFQPDDVYADVIIDFPQDWHVALAVNSILVAILSPTLNLLIICVICRNKELRTPTNTFIASLALGEILFSVFSLPFAAASLLENSWPYSVSTCKWSAFMQTLGRTFSSYCLLLICFDRYIAISRPLKYTNIITLTFSFSSVIIVWCFAMILSVLLLLVWDSYNYEETLFLCTTEINIRINQGSLVKEVLSKYIPIFLTLIYVLAVIKEVKSHHRIFAMVPLPITTNPVPQADRTNVVVDILPISRGFGGFNRNTRRALRSFFIMALSYVILCSPISISGLVIPTEVTLTSDHPSTLVPMWLSILYCVVNPVIIIFFNRKLRSQLKLMLLWVCYCKKKNSGTAHDVFTVSSGLQSVLETTLINKLGHAERTTSITYSIRRTGVSVIT